MPAPDALIAAARNHAAKWNLPPALVCAVCEQESGWDVWAVRYEPAFFAKYVTKLDLPMMEALHRSMSWGLMQIMGEVARELGYQLKFLTQLCDPDVGLEWGCIKLKSCMEQTKRDIPQALLRWNGGGNPEYPQQVMVRMPQYQ